MLPQIAPTLSTLPVEILYQILDNLDSKTILLSFRYCYFEETLRHYLSQSESCLTRLTVGIVTFNEYQNILRSCPRLRTLVIDDCWMNESDQNSSVTFYRQLSSLTLQDTNRSMLHLERFLSLTPSLVQLKIINCSLTPNSLIDGLYWEMLIKTKLFLLRQFQFVFYQLHLRIYECTDDVEVLIRPFRTSFWLEDKRWFVNCQSIKSLHTVKLFSIPFPGISFEYNYDRSNILLSTAIILADSMIR
ncbi:hypothetical protein I4U23_013007 [Adineta vaga]|nr:hypothetical protein I4U23_013007 [Adineta vaga]